MLIGWIAHKRLSSSLRLVERLLSGEKSANRKASYNCELAMIDEIRWFPLKPWKFLVKTKFAEYFLRFDVNFGFG